MQERVFQRSLYSPGARGSRISDGQSGKHFAGASSPRLVEDARGHQYRRPLATMGVYLDGMDKAAVKASALVEPPPTVLAALGPQMTALGWRRTAGVQTYNVTPAHTAAARAIIGPEK